MTRHLSASQLKKHAECPKRWWFRYVSDEDREDEDTRYLDLGSAVHDALEATLRAQPYDGVEEATKKAKSEYSHFSAVHGVPTDMIDDGLEYVNAAVDYTHEQNPEILDVEERVTYRVDKPGIDEEFLGYMDVATTDAIWD